MGDARINMMRLSTAAAIHIMTGIAIHAGTAEKIVEAAPSALLSEPEDAGAAAQKFAVIMKNEKVNTVYKMISTICFMVFNSYA